MSASGLVLLLAVTAAAALDIDDLFRARCTAACVNDPGKKNKCEPSCVLLTQMKPGSCPPPEGLAWHDKACLQSCSRDTDCPSTDKCCSHNCGVTCQPAVGLDMAPGLPSIPTNVTVKDSRRQRCKVVNWTVSDDGGGHVLYVLQSRSQVGPEPRAHMWGPWRARGRRRRSRLLLPDLTPAHWYQVRVAAVNANGSRGFSEPSRPFKLKIEPGRPEEPQNLTVLRPGWVSGRLWAELRWRRPSSDLPLHHYVVFWSHCVKSELEENQSCKPKSVIVKHKTVNYKRTEFILEDLEPQSLYFIQVQAVTIQYGERKLQSEKAAVFIDTNKLKNATYNWNEQPPILVKNLRVLNFQRRAADNLEARVMWESSSSRFLVSWDPTNASCRTALNNPTKQVTTENHEYFIDQLAFNCKYEVVVKAIGNQEKQPTKRAKTNFKTPLCTEVRSQYPCV